jgi:asparagine synthase (glutamine-hydrolysing)
MKGLNEKYLLKRASEGLVPSSVLDRTKQPYRAPEAASITAHDASGYFAELLSPAQLRRDGIFDAAAVGRLVQKSKLRHAISVRDDMALTGILSTQIVIDRFVNHFSSVNHGYAYQGTA